MPHSIAFNVGFKPRNPTRAFTTVEVLLCSIDSNIASSPKETLSWQTKGISLARSITTFFGLNSFICSFNKAIFLPATKTSTFKLNLRAIFSVFTPIEPVLPRSIKSQS